MKKEFTMRDLLKIGAVRREDLDFIDDGNNFRGYEIEGLPISYSKSNGIYYLSLRIDYLEGLNFDEYGKMETYKLQDEFNGVENVDANKVKENAIAIIKEYNEILNSLKDYKVDIDKLVLQLRDEQDYIDSFLDLYRSISLDRLEQVSSYDISRLKDYRKSLRNYVRPILEKLENGELSERALRSMDYMLKEKGYIKFNKNNECFYMESIRKIMMEEK